MKLPVFHSPIAQANYVPPVCELIGYVTEECLVQMSVDVEPYDPDSDDADWS